MKDKCFSQINADFLAGEVLGSTTTSSPSTQTKDVHNVTQKSQMIHSCHERTFN